jgi:hypothetical protein
VRSGGLVAEYVRGKVKRRIAPDRLTHVHPSCAASPSPVGDQVARLRETSERLLRRHGKDIVARQHQQKRIAHAWRWTSAPRWRRCRGSRR